MRTLMSNQKEAFESHQDMKLYAYPFTGTASARRRL
jgi:hypothetical protein